MRERISADPLGVLLRLLLCGVLGLALTGMPLAMLGAFVPALVLPLAVIAAVALWVFWPRTPVQPAGPKLAAALALFVIVATTAVNAKYEGQHVVVDSDPAVYTITGRYLAREGNLRFDSSFRAFGEETKLNYEVIGFHLDAAHHPQYLEPQFLHLVPALLAVAEWIGGIFLMFKASSLIGGIALLALYVFARRIVGPWWATGVVAALAVSMPEAYFVRDSYSEPLSQFFLFGGLSVLWEAQDRGSRRLHLLAGLALGACVMARIDALFYVIPLAAFVAFGPRLASRDAPAHGGARVVLPFAGGIALTTALALLDISNFAPGYLHDLEEVGLIGKGIAAVVAAGLVLAAIGAIRRLPQPPAAWSRWIAIVLLAAAAVVLAKLNYDRQWLSWYYGPLTVVVSLVGLVLLAPLGRGARINWRVVPFLLIFVAVTALYLYRPSITEVHVWAMRRFLPIAIPGILILTFVVADRLWRHAPPRWPRYAARVAAAAIAVVAVVAPAREFNQVRTIAPQGTMGQATQGVCDRLPPKASVVVVQSGRAPFLGAGYPVAIRAFCGVPTASVPPDADIIRRVAADEAERGRRLFVLNQDGIYRGLALPRHVPDFNPVMQILVQTTDQPPRQIAYLPVPFFLYEAAVP